MSYPTRLVTDEADKQRGQFCTSHLGGGGIGDHHEALGTGFPDAPQAVRAEIKELGHLRNTKSKLTVKCPNEDACSIFSKQILDFIKLFYFRI